MRAIQYPAHIVRSYPTDSTSFSDNVNGNYVIIHTQVGIKVFFYSLYIIINLILTSHYYPYLHPDTQTVKTSSKDTHLIPVSLKSCFDTSNTMGTPVSLDAASIKAIAEAMNPLIDQKFALLKQDLANSMAKSDENTKKGMEETVAPLVVRQEAFETKSDKRMTIIENKMDELQAFMMQPSNPPIVSSHPPPDSRVSPAARESSASDQNATAISSIINYARTIVGFSPVTPQHLRNVTANSREDALKLLAIEFLRDELNVKEDEIGEDDIVKVFTSYGKDDDFTHIYVQLTKAADASWCLHLGRTVLKDKDSKVFLYIPRQFFARFKTLDDIAYKKRREGFKTRIDFTDTDIVLLTSPRGQYKFTQLVVPGLPPVDLTPDRTPPKGRKQTKRPRSLNSPPNNDLAKKVDMRESPSSKDDHSKAGRDDEEHGAAAVVAADVGRFQSMETSSPGVGRMLFNFEQSDLSNSRRASLNF